MTCEECAKRQATVHITKIENGKVSDLHLCEQCAMRMNALNITNNFTINYLLAAMLNPAEPLTIKKVKSEANIICEVCGFTYSKFKETGRFGCSACYNAFVDKLNPLLKKIQGSSVHTGKVPRKTGGKIKIIREMQKWEFELETAINNEDFEKAATLRDRIRELNKLSKEA